MNSKNKVVQKQSTKSSDSNNMPNLVLDVAKVAVPKKIAQMDNHSLFQAAKTVFDSFKSLDYASKSSSALDKVEWHSWQVSLLIAILQTQKGSFVPKNDKLFHPTMINSDMSEIISRAQEVVNKYANNINISKSRDELSKDIFWSCKEVSILFYYMSKQ
jgi:hypothetical protein